MRPASNGYVRFFEAVHFGNPQFHASGNLGIGAIDVQQARVIRAHPDQLRDVAVVGEHPDLPCVKIHQLPRRGSLVCFPGVLGGGEQGQFLEWGQHLLHSSGTGGKEDTHSRRIGHSFTSPWRSNEFSGSDISIWELLFEGPLVARQGKT